MRLHNATARASSRRRPTRSRHTHDSPGAGQSVTARAGFPDERRWSPGILSVELHFPEAASLKGKRKYVKSAKAQLQNRFGASVAEVDHHDLWQRARLTVACVARDHRELEGLLDDAVRYLHGQEFELVQAERQVVAPDD